MKRFPIIVILAIGISISSCAQKSDKSVAAPGAIPETQVKTQIPAFQENITATDLRQMIDSKKDIIIIDVRTPAEVADGKIPNAMEINIGDPTFTEKIKALDTTKEYVVYCKAGGRSAKAQKAMQAIGFNKVSNLQGGYDVFKSSGQ